MGSFIWYFFLIGIHIHTHWDLNVESLVTSSHPFSLKLSLEGLYGLANYMMNNILIYWFISLTGHV